MFFWWWALYNVAHAKGFDFGLLTFALAAFSHTCGLKSIGVRNAEMPLDAWSQVKERKRMVVVVMC